jgi:hypothetical protein
LLKDQILKHPIILKRLEIFKATEDIKNEEGSLLQTIRIPKNLLLLSDKLPQPNYEKRSNRKQNNITNNNINSNSFSDEKNELPEIKLNQNINNNKKIIDKKLDRDGNDNNKGDSIEIKNSGEKIKNYPPLNDLSRHNINTEDNKTNNYNLNNYENDSHGQSKKKKRIENNDRSLDNIISHNIYANALGINNIKLLKLENMENNNNSIIKDRSINDDSSSGKRKNVMMLPNIKNQINHEYK